MSDKKIKLNFANEHVIEHVFDEGTARHIIADLQAQLDAPEPVEFWEGQLVEVSDRGDNWYITRYGGHISYGDSRHKDEAETPWRHCRPLQDPLILQFKAHKPGDSMPCDGGLRVRFLRHDGGVDIFPASRCIWESCGTASIIGWMPAAGWGGGE